MYCPSPSLFPCRRRSHLGERAARHGHPERDARFVRRARHPARNGGVRRRALQMEADGADVDRHRRRIHSAWRGAGLRRRGARARAAGRARALPAGSVFRSPSTRTRRGRTRRGRCRRGDGQRRQRPALRAGARGSGRGTAPRLILMHTRGRPTSMYAEAVVRRSRRRDRRASCGASIACAMAAGVPRDRDHRRPRHRVCQTAGRTAMVCWRGCGEMAAALDRPVLVGPSRKSFMRDAIGGRPAAERDWGTAAAVTAAVLGGAHHRSRPRGRGDGAGRCASPRRYDSRRLSSMTCDHHAIFAVPPIGWWDLLDILVVSMLDLRGPEADSRHARRADGARRRRCSSRCSTARGGAISRRSTG